MELYVKINYFLFVLLLDYCFALNGNVYQKNPFLSNGPPDHKEFAQQTVTSSNINFLEFFNNINPNPGIQQPSQIITQNEGKNVLTQFPIKLNYSNNPFLGDSLGNVISPNPILNDKSPVNNQNDVKTPTQINSGYQDLRKYCLKPKGQFPGKFCNSYVNCWDGTAIEQFCPQTLLFNPNKYYCDFSYNVDCQGRPITAYPNYPQENNSTNNIWVTPAAQVGPIIPTPPPPPNNGIPPVPPFNPVTPALPGNPIPPVFPINPIPPVFPINPVPPVPPVNSPPIAPVQQIPPITVTLPVVQPTAPLTSTLPPPIHSSPPNYVPQPHPIYKPTVPPTILTSSAAPIQDNIPSIINDPSLRHKCLKPRGQFPSNSCNKYVNCWDNIAIEQDCPPGLLFSEKGYCDYPYNVNCGKRTRTVKESNSLCLQPEGIFREENDCASYYICSNDNVMAKYKCPAGFNFNTNIGACDYDYKVDCGKFKLIRHPINDNLINQIPAALIDATVHCKEGKIYPLNAQCTSVSVCRRNVAEIVHCPPGLAYDSASDKCLLINLAKC